VVIGSDDCVPHDSDILPLKVRDQSPLRPGVPVDVAFGRLDGAVAGEQLHVAKAAARAMNAKGPGHL
jgi:hypothetical protein